jgi:hypothetical protein
MGSREEKENAQTVHKPKLKFIYRWPNILSQFSTATIGTLYIDRIITPLCHKTIKMMPNGHFVFFTLIITFIQ